MPRGYNKAIGSFLSPSAAPVPMPAEPVTTGPGLVRAFFALHPDRWFTCSEVATETGLSKARCNSAINYMLLKAHLQRHLPAYLGRRQASQTYRWVA